MVSIVGIDSRSFVRDVIKRNGEKGHFESVVGIAIKVRDYIKFEEKYVEAIEKASIKLENGNDLKFLCFNDIKHEKDSYGFLELFFKGILLEIEKVHVFYTLFSKKRLSEVKVYGRKARKERIKLSNPTRTYEQLLSSHILHCFPAICAWRLTEHLTPKTVEFHLDAYEGHIFEAQEKLDSSDHTVVIYPGGDCVNPVISTADLLIEFLDKRLKINSKFLIYENIRPALPEFGENVLVYPISNKHLPFITPLDKQSVHLWDKVKHPVFWVFKGEEIVESGTMKRSRSYRNLQDFVASKYGVVRMFDKSNDIKYFKDGDFGVYLNQRGKEQIDTYIKIGKKFRPFNLDALVPNDLKNRQI
ncbi:hypothetical protein HYU14_02190 [Candidatus Woesearchaeota archaeon]|nr:hypothetical protein [Candidatus Woesearchaeota archaeon]